MDRRGCVYAFRVVGCDTYKIGRTHRTPQARLRQWSNGAGVELEYVAAVAVNDAVTAEAELHAALADSRVSRRELFALDQDELQALLDKMHSMGPNVDAEEYPAGKPESTLTMVNFRLEPELIERLDRYAEDLSDAGPIKYTRVDALRVALAEVFDRHEASRPKKRR